MREIKFKVYNPRLKQMSEPFNIVDLIGCQVTLLHKTHIDEPIEWLQFTGFKDKNGKEIYEGDVVKYQSHTAYGWSDILDYVVVGERQIYGRIDGQLVTGVSFTESKCLSDKAYIRKLEVIGNIWENSELLKENNNG